MIARDPVDAEASTARGVTVKADRSQAVRAWRRCQLYRGGGVDVAHPGARQEL